MISRRAAKELLHIQGWLKCAEDVVERGSSAYLGDVLLQEAGDSLMMKIGEAANRLSKMDVLEPEGVRWAIAIANRNFLIHQYDQINRHLTWQTLSVDLPAWSASLDHLFVSAETVLAAEGRHINVDR